MHVGALASRRHLAARLVRPALLACVVSLFLPAALGAQTWMQAFGGQSTLSYSLAETADGGVVVAGYTNSTGVYNADVLVFRLDREGRTVWRRRYEAPDWEQAWAVHETADGGCIVASKTDAFGAGYDDISEPRTWAADPDAVFGPGRGGR